MEKVFILVFLGLLSFGYGHAQEIVPFIDLTENHQEIYSKIADRKMTYKGFNQDYTYPLEEIDEQIDRVRAALNNHPGSSKKKELIDIREKLLRKRSILLEEAELVDDLIQLY